MEEVVAVVVVVVHSEVVWNKVEEAEAGIVADLLNVQEFVTIVEIPGTSSSIDLSVKKKRGINGTNNHVTQELQQPIKLVFSTK